MNSIFNSELFLKDRAFTFHRNLGLVARFPIVYVRYEIGIQWWDRKKQRQPFFFWRLPRQVFEDEFSYDPKYLKVIFLGSYKECPFKKVPLIKELASENPTGYLAYMIGYQQLIVARELKKIPGIIASEVLPVEHEGKMMYPGFYFNEKLKRWADEFMRM